MTSSFCNADLKGDIFERTIYSLNFTVIVHILSTFELMKGGGVCMCVGGGGGGGEGQSALPKALEDRGPFLESAGNLPGSVNIIGGKCFLTEVNFC